MMQDEIEDAIRHINARITEALYRPFAGSTEGRTSGSTSISISGSTSGSITEGVAGLAVMTTRLCMRLTSIENTLKTTQTGGHVEREGRRASIPHPLPARDIPVRRYFAMCLSENIDGARKSFLTPAVQQALSPLDLADSPELYCVAAADLIWWDCEYARAAMRIKHENALMFGGLLATTFQNLRAPLVASYGLTPEGVPRYIRRL